MQIIPVSKTNLNTYYNLAQTYEAEFSPLTQKQPDPSGMYELDTYPGGDILAFLLEIDNTSAGIAAIARKGDQGYEVCEFYIIPSFRKNSIGMQFAHAIWNNHPGSWEIKQLVSAGYATHFWRKTIERYKNTAFTEELYDDPYWGSVIRQQFIINFMR